MAALTSYLQDLFNTTSAQTGISADYFSKMAKIESGYNTNAYNASGASGLYQFIPSTWKSYGSGSVWSAENQTAAIGKFTLDNFNILKGKLGRDPTSGELYLAHQQGAGGALSLLLNPNTPAADLVGSKAVTQNGGNLSMTGSQFAKLWTSKFSGTDAGSATGAVGDAAKSSTPGTAGGIASGIGSLLGPLGTIIGSAVAGGEALSNTTPEQVAASVDNTADWFAAIEEYIGRGAVIFVGFIFIAMGLFLFRDTATNVVVDIAKGK